jgi:hypothetical protein
MRLVHSAGMVLTLAGLAIATTAAPALADGNPAAAPSTAAPGSPVSFSIDCGSASTGATLFGTTLGLSEHIPMTPQSKTGTYAVEVTLPSSIVAGTYSPSVDCDNGVAGTATVVVTPSGAPITGDGTTATATGGPLTTVGLGVAGLGVLMVGGWALWRRRADSRA